VVPGLLNDPPLPRAVRERRLSLDGIWEVQLEPGRVLEPIVVPFTFEAALSGIGRPVEIHEHLTYRRRFRVPGDWAASNLLLHFAAVDWHAAVEVDGVQIGTHTGGYAHFSFDLGVLDPSTDHELVVVVDDPAGGFQPRGKQRGSGGIWYARATGIWRPVWLEAVPAAHIRSFELDAHVDGTVRVQVETTQPVEVEVRVAGQRVRFRDETTIHVDEPALWSPEQPHLYDVVLETASGDAIESYVAFRSIERRGNEVLLNGERRTICGVLDQAYWPDGVYTAPDGASLRAEVEAVKRFGFDLARMHVKVADPRWYAWCDRIGLLVAQDMPSPLHLATDGACDNFAAELAEIVAQLRGHPCVAIWVVINEDWGEPSEAFQGALVRQVRSTDPGRLVVDASGWKQRGDTDLIDVHDYGAELGGHSSSAELPLWIGECGGVSLVVGGEEDFAYRHVRSPEQLEAEYSRLIGGLGDVAGFVWTQLTDVEGELNGLVTHDRRPKLAPEAIRAVNERLRARRAAV
jgi:beta-galactosidase/beta-glucuronidase